MWLQSTKHYQSSSNRSLKSTPITVRDHVKFVFVDLLEGEDMLTVIHLTKHDQTWSIQACPTPDLCKLALLTENGKKPMDPMICRSPCQLGTIPLVLVKHMNQLCYLAFIYNWLAQDCLPWPVSIQSTT